MKCLSLDYHQTDHLLTMQIESSGIVSRISLTMDKASNFLLSSNGLPSAQSTAAPIAPDSMLTRLDRLCESLGDTLREVVIALFPTWRPDFEELQADPVRPIRELHDQMPSMVRRQCLGFRMSRKSYAGVHVTVFKNRRRFSTSPLAKGVGCVRLGALF